MRTGQIVLRSVVAAVLIGASWACGDSTGVGGAGDVSLSFRVSGSGGAAAQAQGPSRASGPLQVAGPPLVLVGTNGSLAIDEILLIVDEVELHRADGFCADGSSDDDDPIDDDCGELEMSPRMLDLPLDGEPIEAVTAQIAAGTYKRLDFEIEDLEDDEPDAVEAAAIAFVRAQILALVPQWPEEASARVTGTFTPTGGAAADFTVFLKAEIEIELDLVPNLVVDEQGGASRDLTVDISPDIWFVRADGSVMDLTEFDHSQTGRMLEFDVDMEDGFTKIELD
jgi:hypothetical protein